MLSLLLIFTMGKIIINSIWGLDVTSHFESKLRIKKTLIKNLSNFIYTIFVIICFIEINKVISLIGDNSMKFLVVFFIMCLAPKVILRASKGFVYYTEDRK